MEERSAHSSLSDINSEDAVESERECLQLLQNYYLMYTNHSNEIRMISYSLNIES